MKGPYDDIINMPRHVSETRPRMSMYDRAAQFSPFAALTGYEAVVKEAARLTDSRPELAEGEAERINLGLSALAMRMDEQPRAEITYFLPDDRKSGGAFVHVSGRVKRIDEYERTVVFTDGTAVPIEDILKIETELPGEDAEY